jgi:hypothetical protein
MVRTNAAQVAGGASSTISGGEKMPLLLIMQASVVDRKILLVKLEGPSQEVH